jgi:Cytochrome B6-F complex subunit VI (PetL)
MSGLFAYIFFLGGAIAVAVTLLFTFRAIKLI